jgi:hypothetical protein
LEEHAENKGFAKNQRKIKEGLSTQNGRGRGKTNTRS